MKSVTFWIYSLVYCAIAGCIGAFVGAVAGVGIAGMLIEPEEAAVFYTGVGYGWPIGALTGLVLGAFAMMQWARDSKDDHQRSPFPH